MSGYPGDDDDDFWDAKPKPRSKSQKQITADRIKWHRADDDARRIIREQELKKLISGADIGIESGTEFLARDIPHPRPLVDGLLTMDGNALLVAGAKSGKTTLVHNLVRAIADQEPFLGEFPVHRIPGRRKDKIPVLLDFEMHEGLLHEWITMQDIRHPGRFHLGALEGKAHGFDLRDDYTRSAWANLLRQVDCGYLIVDCASPVLSALGIEENSNREVGNFLAGLAALRIESGAYGMLLVHHSGKNGDSARGASRFEGWSSDNLWLTVDDGTRYLTARGRVARDFARHRLDLDLFTNRLTAVRESVSDAAAAELMSKVEANPGRSLNTYYPNGGKPKESAARAVRELSGDKLCEHPTSNKRGSVLWPIGTCPDPELHTRKHRIPR